MSNLPVSLMNRVNQTQSAVFKIWMLYFQRIPLSDYLNGDHKRALSLCSVAAIKNLPVHQYSIVIFTFPGPLRLCGSTLNRKTESLNLGLGGSISHEQTQSNQVYCFQTLDAVFPKDCLIRLFRDQNSCHCAVWSLHVSPYINIQCSVTFTFSGPLGLWGSMLNWKQSIAQPRERRREGSFICKYLSWTDSIKSSMLFSNFRCCIAKGFLIRSFRDYNSCRRLAVPSVCHKMSLHTSIQCYFYVFGPLGLWGVVCVWQEPFHLCIYLPFSKFTGFYLFGPHFDLYQSLNRRPIWNSQNKISDHITDDIPPQMNILNTVIP